MDVSMQQPKLLNQPTVTCTKVSIDGKLDASVQPAATDVSMQQPTLQNQPTVACTKPCVNTLAENLDQLVTAIVGLVRQFPKQALDDHNFDKVMDAARKLIQLRQEILHSPSHLRQDGNQMSSPTFTQQDEEFWHDPENIKVFEHIENAMDRAIANQDMPSFSLGMTQEQQVSIDGELDASAQHTATDVSKQHPTLQNRPTVTYTKVANIGVAMQTAQEGSPPYVAPVKEKTVDRKGKKPLFEKAQPAFDHASTSMAYPTIPKPTSFVVWYWDFNYPQPNRNDVLFHHRGRKAIWGDFFTLKDDTPVSVSIIDAWTYVLNARERTRRWGVPTRLFASTKTTLNTVVNTTASRKDRLCWFTAQLHSDYQLTGHVGWATIDIFIFLVVQQGHFYVMSISFKHQRFDIIDSSSARKTNKEKYGNTPHHLVDLLASFLHSTTNPIRALNLRNMQPKRMQMVWRDSTNKVDSGVFAIHHMESYIGEQCNEWVSGLLRGDVEQISNLRNRYTHNILLADVNDRKESIALRVSQYNHDMLAGRT